MFKVCYREFTYRDHLWMPTAPFCLPLLTSALAEVIKVRSRTTCAPTYKLRPKLLDPRSHALFWPPKFGSVLGSLHDSLASKKKGPSISLVLSGNQSQSQRLVIVGSATGIPGPYAQCLLLDGWGSCGLHSLVLELCLLQRISRLRSIPTCFQMR